MAPSVGDARRAAAESAGRAPPPPASVSLEPSDAEVASGVLAFFDYLRGNFERRQWNRCLSKCVSDCGAPLIRMQCSDHINRIAVFGIGPRGRGCTRWSSETGCTPPSGSWRRELERWVIARASCYGRPLKPHSTVAVSAAESFFRSLEVVLFVCTVCMTTARLSKRQLFSLDDKIQGFGSFHSCFFVYCGIPFVAARGDAVMRILILYISNRNPRPECVSMYCSVSTTVNGCMFWIKFDNIEVCFHF